MIRSTIVGILAASVLIALFGAAAYAGNVSISATANFLTTVSSTTSTTTSYTTTVSYCHPRRPWWQFFYFEWRFNRPCQQRPCDAPGHECNETTTTYTTVTTTTIKCYFWDFGRCNPFDSDPTTVKSG